MVGVAQLVRAPDCGSGGRRFESDHPPHKNKGKVRAAHANRSDFFSYLHTGMSPSGKARDFDSRIRGFESRHPSQSFKIGLWPFSYLDTLAQSVEHLPFKQGVRSSSLRWVTIHSLRFFKAQASVLFVMLGGSEFRLRQGFAAQNACDAPLGADNPEVGQSGQELRTQLPSPTGCRRQTAREWGHTLPFCDSKMGRSSSLRWVTIHSLRFFKAQASILFVMLGGSEFHLRQGFAAQNACDAPLGADNHDVGQSGQELRTQLPSPKHTL